MALLTTDAAVSPLGMILEFFEVSDEAFLARLRDLKAELAPADTVEAFLVARILQSIARLRHSARNPPETPDHRWMRLESLTDRQLWSAFRELEARRRRLAAESRREARGRAPAVGPADACVKPCQSCSTSPILTVGPSPAIVTTDPGTATEPSAPLAENPESVDPPADDHKPRHWRFRVAIDPAVSELWPVIIGTSILVEQVATMLSEGRAPAEIRRRLPVLTDDDIRVCRDCDAEGLCGPWLPGQEPPIPPVEDSSAPESG